jgi:Flp pilus assembly protein TadD
VQVTAGWTPDDPSLFQNAQIYEGDLTEFCNRRCKGEKICTGGAFGIAMKDGSFYSFDDAGNLKAQVALVESGQNPLVEGQWGRAKIVGVLQDSVITVRQVSGGRGTEHLMLQRVVQLSVIVMPAMLAAAATCERPVEVRQRAAAAYAQGNLQSAIGQLRQAIQSCPTESFFEFMLGNALYRSGEVRESAEHYRKFLAARPENIEAHLSLGFALFETGDRQQALEQWRAAVVIDPKSPFARAALAVGLYANGDPVTAATEYNFAVQLDSRYADTAALGIDIRWKPAVRGIAAEIIRHSAS